MSTTNGDGYFDELKRSRDPQHEGTTEKKKKLKLLHSNTTIENITTITLAVQSCHK